MFTPRFLLFGISAFCAAAIASALYMQHVLMMEPCALCITQRIFMIAVGVFAFIGGLLTSKPIALKVSSAVAVIAACIGASVAGRHVWIQNLPEDQVPECGPGLAYMFETRPFFDALSVLLSGDGHCADVHFSFLGLTIPGWTLVAFVGMALTLIYVLIRGARKQDAII